MKTLIIINPVSGQSKSLSIYKNIRKFLYQNLDIEELITLYSEHVDDYFSKYLDRIIEKDLIIGIGGDGLLYHIINNIKKYDIDIILSEIPTGSGNGFFKSLMNKSGKEFSIENSVKLINFPVIKNVDCMYIENLDLYSRLSISWGIISNIDIDTEWMRWLGHFRFDLGGIFQVLYNPTYSGKLSFEIGRNKTIIERDFSFVWAGNVSHASSDVTIFPDAKFNDNKIHLAFVYNDVSRIDLIKILLGLSDGSYLQHEKVHYFKVDKFNLETIDGKIVVDGELLNVRNINAINKQNELKILTF